MLHSMTTTDPAALFRSMLGEWEKLTNSVGGDLLKSEEWARTMHGASAATTNAQAAMKTFMERSLAAANMPSRTEFENLSARIGGIEDSLARIEALLGAAKARPPGASKPTRKRTPPEGKA